jgi:hypothetical protein
VGVAPDDAGGVVERVIRFPPFLSLPSSLSNVGQHPLSCAASGDIKRGDSRQRKESCLVCF